MNHENIREIAAIMKESGLTLVEITEGDTIIHLERQAAPAAEKTIAVSTPAQPEFVPAAAVAAAAEKYDEIRSPMVGVFYKSPSPDADPFVQVGDDVNPGDVVCIIEAMKLLNEITAEASGRIVEICVENAQVVEYGQTLFKLAKE
jgi:acetyl-CoA carboxylase biotin carboxyl carrier protein